MLSSWYLQFVHNPFHLVPQKTQTFAANKNRKLWVCGSAESSPVHVFFGRACFTLQFTSKMVLCFISQTPTLLLLDVKQCMWVVMVDFIKNTKVQTISLLLKSISLFFLALWKKHRALSISQTTGTRSSQASLLLFCHTWWIAPPHR